MSENRTSTSAIPHRPAADARSQRWRDHGTIIDDELIGVDATAGTIATKINVGDKVYVPPVVAEGRLYVLTNSAKLMAFR